MRTHPHPTLPLLPYLPSLADGQLEALKWLALISMVIDHVGRYGLNHPLESWAFALGRLAFPLFAIVLAMNLARPGDRVGRAKRVARRLIVWAAISLIPSWWARGAFWPINVLGTLALAAAFVLVVESVVESLARWTAVLGILVVSVACEFGPAGVLLVASVYGCRARGGVEWFVLAGGAAFVLAGTNGLVGGQMALWITLVGIAIPWLVQACDLPIYRYSGFFYLFYPTHLVAICLWRIFAGTE